MVHEMHHYKTHFTQSLKNVLEQMEHDMKSTTQSLFNQCAISHKMLHKGKMAFDFNILCLLHHCRYHET